MSRNAHPAGPRHADVLPEAHLQVAPKDAQVYVDGYYAGTVDDFDGHFQHLDLSPQLHHVEIRAPGYQPLVFDVVIQPHHKTNYRGKLLPSTP